MTAPQKGRIFISYRRADSAGYAGRIYDRLTAHFGKDAVFMDVDTIEAGLDFVEVLENAVQSCDVLVALIGRQWLRIKDEEGKRRLDNPQDFVRIEIAAALSRSIRVIPVLVDGVPMPHSDQLPSNLKLLARRNAVLINHYSFHNDANRLIEQLELALNAAEESKILKAKELKEKEAQQKSQAEIEKLLSQADIALDLKGWDLAKEKLEAVLILEPDHIQAQVKLAIVERRLQEIGEKNLTEENAKQKVAEKAVQEKTDHEDVEKVTREKAHYAELESAEKVFKQKTEREGAVKVFYEKVSQFIVTRLPGFPSRIDDVKSERGATKKSPGVAEKIPGSQPGLQQSILKWAIIGAIVATGVWGISYLAGSVAPTTSAEPTEPAQPETTFTEMAEVPVGGEIDCKGAQPGDEISMLYQWSEQEEERLYQILQPLVEACGIVLRPETTRDRAVLDTLVLSGTPLDIVFWQRAILQDYQDRLLEMDTLGANPDVYIPGTIELGVINDRWLGLPVKLDIKSLIWYSPVNFDALDYPVPTTWEELENLVEQIANDPRSPVPWSMGLESGAATGWTGSDFIQDILLVQQGPHYVTDIIYGRIPYDDEGVKRAYETYGRWAMDPAYTIDGAEGTLTIQVLDAIYMPFYDPPEAMMVRQASFAGGEIAAQFPDLQFGSDYDFFVFPGARGLQGGTDLMMALNDKPAVQALVTYLSSPDGGANWAKAGFGLSPNRNAAGNYTDRSLQKWADAFYNTEGFTPDIGDTLPGNFIAAEWTAILDYLNGAGLDEVLAKVATIQAEALNP